jgi:propanol-preferring alcohol dehydrogenase
MRAMVFEAKGQPLRLTDLPDRHPKAGEVLLEVSACAVCRTDLHVVDGDLTKPKLPLVPGHEIVGRVIETAPDVDQFQVGDRVGVPWLGWTCGTCDFCQNGLENLCESARFTGYDIDGGYAERTIADARYCFPIPEHYADADAAPLLCAGLIGYRSLVKAGDASRLGLYGFGAAAHIVAQVATFQGRDVFAFTRPGDQQAQDFARRSGCVWAGSSTESPPVALDAAILFAPIGALIPAALESVRPGGTVVCGGIHMSDIPAFSYDLLWREKTVVSVANLTREDGQNFLSLAGQIPIQMEIAPFSLADANQALAGLREGRLTGAAVLKP